MKSITSTKPEQNGFHDDLVKRALTDRRARIMLHEEMNALARLIAALYTSHVSTDELARIGMTDFDRALKSYGSRFSAGNSKSRYKFSTYLTWYIKNSIEAHLGISDETSGSVPRDPPP